jgi:ribosomal protein S18 acetylase RimI-like enzyme
LQHGDGVLKVRRAEARDVRLLAQLGETTYRSHFAGIWSPARMDAYIAAEYGEAALAESLARPELSIWLIGEMDAEPIGFAKLNWNRPLPVADGRIGTELQKIYLQAERTGQGHGGRMLEAVVERARQRDDRWLWLDVLKSNAGARAFYERHGFRAVGEIPFATDLREIGMWVMAREV